MKYKLITVIGALIIGISGWCFAEIPETINFQGRLTDGNGAPLTDGNHTIRVFIYDQPDGAYGNRPDLWRDVFDAPTQNGYFNIILGNKPTNRLNAVAFKQQLYVGIKLGTDNEMKPCQPLSSVPYAMNSMNATNGVPVGTILPFGGGGPQISAGWLLCDGTALKSNEYPGLYDVIKNNFGNGSTTSDGRVAAGCDFNLPDLRGQFLRGVDGNAGKDPDSQSRAALKSGGNVGNSVGSAQGDMFATHTHTYSSEPNSGVCVYVTSSGPTLHTDHNTPTTSGAGGSETRPKNVYVNYIIKY